LQQHSLILATALVLATAGLTTTCIGFVGFNLVITVWKFFMMKEQLQREKRSWSLHPTGLAKDPDPDIDPQALLLKISY
jgi:hypothetical protein